MAYHFLDSKLDRALVAYLIEWGAGTADNCYPALRSLNKPLPNISIHTHELSLPDGDMFSGGRIADVDIVITRSQIGESPLSTDTSNSKRLAFEQMAGDVCDALNEYGQSSDLLCDAINAAAYAKAASEAANHSDLTDFAVDWLIPTGESQGFTKEGNWQKTFKLQCGVVARSISEA